MFPLGTLSDTDPVYEIREVGKYLNLVDTWDQVRLYYIPSRCKYICYFIKMCFPLDSSRGWPRHSNLAKLPHQTSLWSECFTLSHSRKQEKEVNAKYSISRLLVLMALSRPLVSFLLARNTGSWRCTTLRLTRSEVIEIKFSITVLTPLYFQCVTQNKKKIHFFKWKQRYSKFLWITVCSTIYRGWHVPIFVLP